MAHDVDLLTTSAKFEVARGCGLRAFLGRVYLKVAAGLALSTALVSTFLVTAAAFVGLISWGYLTKRNLSGFDAGLIAADTQRLKRIYYRTTAPDALEASSNYSALTLYLNFINLFELLFSLSGSRSRR